MDYLRCVADYSFRNSSGSSATLAAIRASSCRKLSLDLHKNLSMHGSPQYVPLLLPVFITKPDANILD
jgi:hypothetical protein